MSLFKITTCRIVTETFLLNAIARKSRNRKIIKSDKLIGYCVEAKHCHVLYAEVTQVKHHNLKAMIIIARFRFVERLRLTPYDQSCDISLASTVANQFVAFYSLTFTTKTFMHNGFYTYFTIGS